MATSYQAKILQYQYSYNLALFTGTYTPYLIPQAFLGYVVLFLYLIVPPNLSKVQPLYRYTLFTLILSLSLYNILYARALESTSGNMNGVLSAWCILWSAIFLIWTDPQHDFRRLERRPKDKHGPLEPELKDPPEYYWRGRPASLTGRVFWTADLLTNLRGRNWQWRFIRRSPREISSRLQEYRKEEGPILQSTLRRLVLLVVCVDVGKGIMMQDRYFWGEVDHPAMVLTAWPLLDYGLASVWHTVFSLAGIYTALLGIQTVQTLVCLHMLGREVMGIPGEGWMYPPLYGPWSSMLEKGIKGQWGIFWHQGFRLPLTAAGTWVVDTFGLDPGSQSTKFAKLITAFALSGALHFAESYSTWPSTSPWKTYTFFLLQPLGMVMQDAVVRRVWGNPSKVKGEWAKRSLCVFNAGTTLLFFFCTFPLLGDDIARAGLWLAEPLPVSPTRMLGGTLGVMPGEEGWQWRWGGRAMEWYDGGPWWRRGLRVL